jgi:hypothetical protein
MVPYAAMQSLEPNRVEDTIEIAYNRQNLLNPDR